MKKAYILAVLVFLLISCGTKKKVTNRYNNDTEITATEKSENTEKIVKSDSSSSETKDIKTETKEEKSEKSTETVEIEEGTDINVKGDGSGEITMTEEKTDTGVKRTWTGVDEISVINTRRELNQQITEMEQSNTNLSQEITKKDSRIQYLESELSAKSERILELEQSERGRESDSESKGFRWWNLVWVLPVILLVLAVRQIIRSRGKRLP